MTLKEQILSTPGRPRVIAEALGTSRQYVRAARCRARVDGLLGAEREIRREINRARGPERAELRRWLRALLHEKRAARKGRPPVLASGDAI